MKSVRKTMCFALALVMTLAMTLTVHAEGTSGSSSTPTNKITVTNVQEAETYRIYKLLDLSVDTGKKAYSYTVNVDWKDFFTTPEGGEAGAGAAYVDIDKVGNVTWKADKADASDMEMFAKAAAEFAKGKSVKAVSQFPADEDLQEADRKPVTKGEKYDAAVQKNVKTITFEALDPGYYLITSTNGTLAMIDTTPDTEAVEVKEKNPNPTVDKKVKEDSSSKWLEWNSAQIGDTVDFKTTITLQKGAKNYVMHDKMGKGLTFKADSVKVAYAATDTELVEKSAVPAGNEWHYTLKTGNAVSDYTDEESKKDEICTFEIEFNQEYLDKITGETKLVVTYSAVLNGEADIVYGEKNDAKLTWGDASKTVWSETTTKTYQFSVLKYDKEDEAKTPLAGATFKLQTVTPGTEAGIFKYNDVKLVKVTEGTEGITDVTYRVATPAEIKANKTETNQPVVDDFTTVSTGMIIIQGVDLDVYQLVEIKAPAGYHMLKEAVPVDMTKGNEQSILIDIANEAGVRLPSTGGIGTTLFYVFGGVLVLAAAALLVTKKHMNKAD